MVTSPSTTSIWLGSIPASPRSEEVGRASTFTKWPRRASSRTRRAPTNPVPPVTSTRGSDIRATYHKAHGRSPAVLRGQQGGLGNLLGHPRCVLVRERGQALGQIGGVPTSEGRCRRRADDDDLAFDARRRHLLRELGQAVGRLGIADASERTR